MTHRLLSALLVGLVACAAGMHSGYADAEATLTRGGGIAGLTETVRIWSDDSGTRAGYERTDRRGSEVVRLPARELHSTLVWLESIVNAAPPMPPDSGSVRPVCADVILTHIEVRNGGRVQSAQEECPHRTPASEAYWQRVDSVFRSLAAAAR